MRSCLPPLESHLPRRMLDIDSRARRLMTLRQCIDYRAGNWRYNRFIASRRGGGKSAQGLGQGSPVLASLPAHLCRSGEAPDRMQFPQGFLRKGTDDFTRFVKIEPVHGLSSCCELRPLRLRGWYSGRRFVGPRAQVVNMSDFRPPQAGHLRSLASSSKPADLIAVLASRAGKSGQLTSVPYPCNCCMEWSHARGRSCR